MSKDNSACEKIRVFWGAFHIVTVLSGINPAVHTARGMHPHRHVSVRPLLGRNFAPFAYTFNVR